MTLTESDLATLRSCASAHVSDAMEMLALRRTVITGYSLIGDPGITVVGTAFTVRQVPKHAIHAKDMGLVRHKEVSYKQARAGEVVVVDVGGWTDVCSWGEFHSYHCKSRGVAGTVLNGATRDAHGIRMLGYPVFCRGFSPVKSRWDLETVGLRETVTLGRVQVRHGDIVVADETGILIVPPEHKDAIVGKAAEVRDAEVEEMARLRQGMPLR